MKGTAKRGRTTVEDQQQAEWLHNSSKNRAENVMIVDMIRNDLGRIAQIGSVQVPQLFAIEKYPTLFQMTSTVKATTQASIAEIFTALFPCASITGAPKVSTMNIIAELETTPRKLYTGSIGFISPNRKAQFNVAIRTAIIDNEAKLAEYGVGGGVVWDSTHADEYQETLFKSQVLTQPRQDFSLLETILWTPQGGYFLREKHIARMADSAEYFDFSFSENELNNLFYEMAKKFKSPQRLRILLDHLGKLAYESQEYIEQKKTLKVKLAKQPINSSDAFFFHKTTNRVNYPAVPGYDDVLLFNEQEELTEFTIGNLVVRIDGELYTPPISCGLLAGTFRAHLLEMGQLKERVIHKGELNVFEKIYLINSVRKWVEVEI
jgi:para-aminobenzoate synthetase / 4-amino-4-deoxychorismate lyase